MPFATGLPRKIARRALFPNRPRRPLRWLGDDASGTRGVLNDAISLYFADATLASAFVARWCAGSKSEAASDMFQVREDEPAPPVGACCTGHRDRPDATSGTERARSGRASERCGSEMTDARLDRQSPACDLVGHRRFAMQPGRCPAVGWAMAGWFHFAADCLALLILAIAVAGLVGIVVAALRGR